MFKPEDKTIEEIVRRIIATVQPDRIILFGSHARGAAAPDSDIDLVVVVSGNIHRRKTAQKIYMNLIGVGRSVDVIVLKPEDLEKYKNSAGVIIPEILREGKELYVA
jgi:predicted nucleotidyltransferase